MRVVVMFCVCAVLLVAQGAVIGFVGRLALWLTGVRGGFVWIAAGVVALFLVGIQLERANQRRRGVKLPLFRWKDD